MSATSMSRAANDVQLQARVNAMVQKQAFTDKADTDFGTKVHQGMVQMTPMYWAVAVDTEDAYAEALLGGNGSPGYDETVISDEDITAAVVAHWPDDPPPVTRLAPAAMAMPAAPAKEDNDAEQRQLPAS